MVRYFHSCAKKRVKLRKQLIRLKLFPAARPLEAVAMDIFGPLTKTRAGKLFLLRMTDRIMKLTQLTALGKVTARNAAVAFCES